MPKNRKLPRLPGGGELPDGVKQPPRLMGAGTKALIAVALVLIYGGLITVGIFSYTNSTLFTVILVVMVLVPPVLGYVMMAFLSPQIDGFYRKLDESDQDDEDEEGHGPDGGEDVLPPAQRENQSAPPHDHS